MPKIPQQQTLTQTTGVSTARLNVQASDEDFGAGTGRALKQVGNVFERRALELKEQQDTTAATDAYMKATDELRTFTNEIQKRKQGDAKGITSETNQFIAELQSKYGTELANKSQLERFESLLKQKRSATLDGMARYEAAEDQAYTKDTFTALRDEARDSAVENPYNQPMINQSVMNTDAAVERLFKGASRDVIDQEKEKARSELHKGVISRRLTRDAVGARIYYEQNYEDINGDDRTTIEAALKKGDIREQAQALVDQTMVEYDDMEAGLKAIRSKVSGELEDEAVRRYKTRHAEAETIKKRNHDETIENVWKVYEGKKIEGAPPEEFEIAINSLPTKESRAVMRADYNAWVSAKSIPTRWETYDMLVDMAIKDPDQFKSRNLAEHDYADLNYTERHKLREAQKRMKENDLSFEEVDWSGATRSQMLKETLSKSDIITSNMNSTEEAAVRASYSQALDREQKAFVARHKREPDPTELQEMIDSLIVNKKVRFTTTDFILFDWESEKELDLPTLYEEIDLDDRQAIIADYKTVHGVEPTVDEIVTMAVDAGVLSLDVQD